MKKQYNAIIMLLAIISFGLIQARGSVGDNQFEKFIIAIKSLEVGKDTPDDVVAKVGRPGQTIKWMGTETWVYPASEAETTLRIGKTGKLILVQVRKGNKDIYIMGNWDDVPAATVDTPSLNELVAPTNQAANPKLGQIYINPNDSHFYGWNGKEWKQLDK